MLDPYPAKVVLSAKDVADMLSMGLKTFNRFLAEEPTFPKPLTLGKHDGTRKGDRLRWRKEEVLIWLLRRPTGEEI
jgi:predicted DNA-binding transcriptional regulator AlpA